MRTSKFTETQIITILKQGDALLAVKDLCRQAGISTATYYQWKSKYGGLEAPEHRRVKDLETENARLKRMYAEMALNNAALKDLMAKNCRAGSEAGGSAFPHRGACASPEPVLRLRGPVSCGTLCAATGLDRARCGVDLGGTTLPRELVQDIDQRLN